MYKRQGLNRILNSHLATLPVPPPIKTAKKEKLELRFCAEKCFDKALITRNPADEDALVELLNSIDSDMKNILQDYFADRYFYFRQYSKPLAKELARIYNWPENNDKRRNEVTK